VTGYLVDTCILSETRKVRPHGGVLAWLRAQRDEHLHLPALVFGEIQSGIESIRNAEPQRAAHLDAWVKELQSHPRILPMDAACFRIWAVMMRKKAPDLAFDAMIAATAKVHDLTVATRDVRHFALFDVSVMNPFEYRL
jgi:hypothetical protein